MSATASPLVEVRDLVKHFPIRQGVIFQRQIGAVKAVDGVSFDVLDGETLGIVGETGCGKSTTARLLVRLLDPTSGSIMFEGDDIATASGGSPAPGALILRRRPGRSTGPWPCSRRPSTDRCPA